LYTREIIPLARFTPSWIKENYLETYNKKHVTNTWIGNIHGDNMGTIYSLNLYHQYLHNIKYSHRITKRSGIGMEIFSAVLKNETNTDSSPYKRLHCGNLEMKNYPGLKRAEALKQCSMKLLESYTVPVAYLTALNPGSTYNYHMIFDSQPLTFMTCNLPKLEGLCFVGFLIGFDSLILGCA